MFQKKYFPVWDASTSIMLPTTVLYSEIDELFSHLLSLRHGGMVWLRHPHAFSSSCAFGSSVAEFVVLKFLNVFVESGSLYMPSKCRAYTFFDI